MGDSTREWTPCAVALGSNGVFKAFVMADTKSKSGVVMFANGDNVLEIAELSGLRNRYGRSQRDVETRWIIGEPQVRPFAKRHGRAATQPVITSRPSDDKPPIPL